MSKVQTDSRINVVPDTDNDLTSTEETGVDEIIVDYTDGAPKFSEQHALIIDERFEYKRSGSDPGLVLIFNQERFDEQELYREGSRKDVRDAISCMSRLGYNITKDNVFNDLDTDDILKRIDIILSKDLREVNCVILFFLTHGDPNNILYARHNHLSADKIWKKFVNCKDLQGKPKLFLFQACKGGEMTCNDYSQKEGSNHVPALVPPMTFTTDYLAPDMMIVYSTLENTVSFRYPKEGSWFIQELCQNFSTYGRRDDVTSLITRTTKCVCSNHFYNDNKQLVKQMPLFISTLTKKFYLTRSKDRSLVLDNLRRLNDLHDSIQKVLEQIDALRQANSQQKGKKKK